MQTVELSAFQAVQRQRDQLQDQLDELNEQIARLGAMVGIEPVHGTGPELRAIVDQVSKQFYTTLHQHGPAVVRVRHLHRRFHAKALTQTARTAGGAALLQLVNELGQALDSDLPEIVELDEPELKVVLPPPAEPQVGKMAEHPAIVAAGEVEIHALKAHDALIDAACADVPSQLSWAGRELAMRRREIERKDLIIRQCREGAAVRQRVIAEAISRLRPLRSAIADQVIGLLQPEVGRIVSADVARAYQPDEIERLRKALDAARGDAIHWKKSHSSVANGNLELNNKIHQLHVENGDLERLVKKLRKDIGSLQLDNDCKHNALIGHGKTIAELRAEVAKLNGIADRQGAEEDDLLTENGEMTEKIRKAAEYVQRKLEILRDADHADQREMMEELRAILANDFGPSTDGARIEGLEAEAQELRERVADATSKLARCEDRERERVGQREARIGVAVAYIDECLEAGGPGGEFYWNKARMFLTLGEPNLRQRLAARLTSLECRFCGWHVQKRGMGNDEKRRVLTEHMNSCEKHPQREVERRLAKAEAQLKDWHSTHAELLSEVADVARRIGVANTPGWIKGKLEAILNTQGRRGQLLEFADKRVLAELAHWRPRAELAELAAANWERAAKDWEALATSRLTEMRQLVADNKAAAGQEKINGLTIDELSDLVQQRVQEREKAVTARDEARKMYLDEQERADRLNRENDALCGQVKRLGEKLAESQQFVERQRLDLVKLDRQVRTLEQTGRTDRERLHECQQALTAANERNQGMIDTMAKQGLELSRACQERDRCQAEGETREAEKNEWHRAAQQAERRVAEAEARVGRWAAEATDADARIRAITYEVNLIAEKSLLLPDDWKRVFMLIPRRGQPDPYPHSLREVTDRAEHLEGRIGQARFQAIAMQQAQVLYPADWGRLLGLLSDVPTDATKGPPCTPLQNPPLPPPL